jgi:hypothetical protein
MSEVKSFSNRDFTTTEEADISCYELPEGVKREFFDNMTWLTKEGVPGVQIFAIGDNLYLCHQETSCELYITDHLKDAIDAACEILATS